MPGSGEQGVGMQDLGRLGQAIRLDRSSPGPLAALFAMCAIASSAGCDAEQRDKGPQPASSAPSKPAAAEPAFETPRLLFLPDAGDVAPPEAPFSRLTPAVPSQSACPAEMVWVQRSYCVDRYETALRDSRQGRALSPYYHPDPSLLGGTFDRWRARAPAAKTALGRRLRVPEPPTWQLSEAFEIRAYSERGVVPSGYLNQPKAIEACRNAGKRLCTREEWVTACRGERGTKFPYGEQYQADRCNVNRPAHPAALLHGNASIHHLDPRLNLTEDHGKALLRRTGETSSCSSTWGNDAIYDMVGNLDEWIDEPDGMFLGGFFSRATREGCDAAISSHPPEYYDYSLGVRCCLSLGTR